VTRVHRRPRRGFTLVELVITLTLVGIVGTVTVNVMLSQSRHVQQATEQIRVREALRQSSEILSADLRGLAPAQGDLADFTGNSLTVRATVGSGIVCAVNGSASVDLVPPDAAIAPMTYFVDSPVVGDTLQLLRLSDNSWQAMPITGVSSGTSACPATSSVFVTAADAAKARPRLTAAIPAGVAAGDVVRVTRPVRYTVTRQGSGIWYLTRSEYRSGAWSSAVAAGPFRSVSGTEATGGLGVTVYDDAGVALATADRTRAARVALVLRGLGRATSAPSGQYAYASADSLVISVALRNR